MGLIDEVEEHPARVASAALIIAALFGCPYALGGTSLTVIGSLAVASLLAALLALVDARRSRQGLAFGLAGAALVVMVVVVGLQCVPLPASLLARLDPTTDDLLQFTLGPKHLYPAARPLSLDPPATHVEWIKAASYLALYVAAAQVARSRTGRRALLFALAALGGSLVLCAGMHYAFDLHTIYGVEGWTREGLVTPYVDRNHLASALNLATLIQLGLAFRTDDRRKTVAWAGLAIATGTAALLANSRAGALSLAAGVAVFSAFLGRRAEGDRRVRSIRTALAATLGVGAVGIAVYLNSELLLARWATLFDEKVVSNSVVSLWPTVWPLVKAHWLTGVGRGAFLVAFPRYQVNFADNTVTHPENIMLQLTSELGLIVGLGLLVVLAGAWVESVRRFDLSAAEAGVAAGVFAVGLHEFADFGLELTGVVVPTLVAMAALEIRPEARSVIPFRVGAVALLVLVVAGMAVALPPPHLLLRDRAELDAAVKNKAPAADVEAKAWEMAAQHPMDYVLQTTPAFADVRAKPPQPGAALGWANRAMYLAPLSPWPHRAAAEALIELGKRQQATLEYRLAFPGLKRDVEFRAELRRLLHTPEELADAVTQDAEGFAFAMDLVSDRPADEAAIGELALSRLALEEPEVLKRLAAATAQKGDHDRALALAIRNLEASDSKPGGFIEVASQQEALRRNDDAEATLRDGLVKNPGNIDLMIALAAFLARHDRASDGHDLLKQIAVHGVADRLRVLDADYGIWNRQNLSMKALPDLREGAQLDPRNPNRRFELARLLESQGRLREAVITITEGISLQAPEQRAPNIAWRARLTAQIDGQQRDQMLREADHLGESDAPP